METFRGRRVRTDVLDTIDELERRLSVQRAQLEDLAKRVSRMRRVHAAARAYVLAPYADATEDGLARELELAVRASEVES